MSERGPIYDVELCVTSLPIGTGGMSQAMPTANDLTRVANDCSQRTAAGYEVLLAHYVDQRDQLTALRARIENAIVAATSCNQHTAVHLLEGLMWT